MELRERRDLSERLGPSNAVSFESLNVQLFIVGSACCPHCKQDLGPLVSQTPKNRLMDVVLAATPIVSPGPFGVGQAGETPVSERTPEWLDTSSHIRTVLHLPLAWVIGLQPARLERARAESKRR